MLAIVDLTCELIRRASVTPDDAGCQALIAERLARAGFAIEHLRYGEVDNSGRRTARRAGARVPRPHRCRADRARWSVDQPAVRADHPRWPSIRPRRGGHEIRRRGDDARARRVRARASRRIAGTVALLLTSDEEGAAKRRRAPRRRGIPPPRPAHRLVRRRRAVVARAARRLIRVGRRGSLTGRLRVRGVQGHVAYPDRRAIRSTRSRRRSPSSRRRAGTKATMRSRRRRSRFRTSMPGTGADNVIPGELRRGLQFPLRHREHGGIAARAHRSDPAPARRRLRRSTGGLSGEPFLTREGPLRAAVVAAIREHCGIAPEAEHRRRHIGRPLHRAARRRSRRARPGQREHPQDRRIGRARRARAAAGDCSVRSSSACSRIAARIDTRCIVANDSAACRRSRRACRLSSSMRPGIAGRGDRTSSSRNGFDLSRSSCTNVLSCIALRRAVPADRVPLIARPPRTRSTASSTGSASPTLLAPAGGAIDFTPHATQPGLVYDIQPPEPQCSACHGGIAGGDPADASHLPAVLDLGRQHDGERDARSAVLRRARHRQQRRARRRRLLPALPHAARLADGSRGQAGLRSAERSGERRRGVPSQRHLRRAGRHQQRHGRRHLPFLPSPDADGPERRARLHGQRQRVGRRRRLREHRRRSAVPARSVRVHRRHRRRRRTSGMYSEYPHAERDLRHVPQREHARYRQRSAEDAEARRRHRHRPSVPDRAHVRRMAAEPVRASAGDELPELPHAADRSAGRDRVLVCASTTAPATCRCTRSSAATRGCPASSRASTARGSITSGTHRTESLDQTIDWAREMLGTAASVDTTIQSYTPPTASDRGLDGAVGQGDQPHAATSCRPVMRKDGACGSTCRCAMRTARSCSRAARTTPRRAVLTEDAQARVYEVLQGIWNHHGTGACDVEDGDGDPMFHFVLNDCIAKDSRIPPLGFTPATASDPNGYDLRAGRRDHVSGNVAGLGRAGQLRHGAVQRCRCRPARSGR